MNSLVKKQPEESIVLAKVSGAVANMNALRKFPLNDEQIEGWGRIILRLMPLEDIRKLQFVVDEMIRGNLEFDSEIGIRNIFLNVKSVQETEKGFEILKANY